MRGALEEVGGGRGARGRREEPEGESGAAARAGLHRSKFCFQAKSPSRAFPRRFRLQSMSAALFSYTFIFSAPFSNIWPYL